MTPEQWLTKHYPVPASALAEASDEECLLHCENKWEGAKEENLPDECSYKGYYVYNKHLKKVLSFSDVSCALCSKYPDDCKTIDGEECPIVRMNSYPCCYVNEYFNGPVYRLSHSDPAPMIDLLKRTLEFVRNGG